MSFYKIRFQNIQNTNIQPITYDGFWEDEVKVNTNKRKRKIIDGINYTTIKFRHSGLTSQKSGLLIIPPTNMELDIPKRGRLIQNHPVFGAQYETVLNSQNIKTKDKPTFDSIGNTTIIPTAVIQSIKKIS